MSGFGSAIPALDPEYRGMGRAWSRVLEELATQRMEAYQQAVADWERVHPNAAQDDSSTAWSDGQWEYDAYSRGFWSRATGFEERRPLLPPEEVARTLTARAYLATAALARAIRYFLDDEVDGPGGIRHADVAELLHEFFYIL